MVTRKNELAETVRQWTAEDAPFTRGSYVHNANKEWADDLINLYDSVDKYSNCDNAIINKLGEVRDERSAMELKFLLDRVDTDVRKEFVEKFFAYDGSCTKIVVKWAGYTDLKYKNSGRIRLYLSKDGKEKMVYFGRSATIIVFLICLLDIYNAEVRPLDFANRKEQFRELFMKVFAYDGGMDCFKNLIGRGNAKQVMLRHSFSDIRKTFASTCSVMHEDVSPYMLYNNQSHLNILKKNIVIDDKLLNME